MLLVSPLLFLNTLLLLPHSFGFLLSSLIGQGLILSFHLGHALLERLLLLLPSLFTLLLHLSHILLVFLFL